MKEERELSALTEGDRQLLDLCRRQCLDPDTDATTVYYGLMAVVEHLSAALERDLDSLRPALDAARDISEALMDVARENRALRYTYFGMYQVYLEQLQERLRTVRAEQVRQAAFKAVGTKHLEAILGFLYTAGQMPTHNTLSRALGIDRSNLTREMTVLIQVGYVEKIPSGKYRRYRLTAKGEEYVVQKLLRTSGMGSGVRGRSRDAGGYAFDIVVHYQMDSAHPSPFGINYGAGDLSGAGAECADVEEPDGADDREEGEEEEMDSMDDAYTGAPRLYMHR